MPSFLCLRLVFWHFSKMSLSLLPPLCVCAFRSSRFSKGRNDWNLRENIGLWMEWLQEHLNCCRQHRNDHTIDFDKLFLCFPLSRFCTECRVIVLIFIIRLRHRIDINRFILFHFSHWFGVVFATEEEKDKNFSILKTPIKFKKWIWTGGNEFFLMRFKRAHTITKLDGLQFSQIASQSIISLCSLPSIEVPKTN